MRKSLILFLIFILCKEKKEAKLAILFEISGKYYYYAKEAILGIDFFKNKNKELPFKIEIIDFKSDSESLRVNLEKIINVPEFLCVLGPLTSKFALYASDICEKNGLPLITPTATSPFITEGKNYVYRMSYSDIEQGRALARFAREYLGLDRFAIVYKKEDPYSKILFEEFKKSVQEMKGEIIAVEEFDEKEILSKISSLKKASPPLIFVPLHTDEVIFFVKKCIDENFVPLFLGGDGWYSYEIIKEFGNYADKEIKVFISSPFHPDEEIEGYSEFVNEFEIEYGKKPSFLSAFSYESIQFLFKSFKNLRILNRENLNNFIKKNYVPKKKVWILKLKKDGFDVILGI